MDEEIKAEEWRRHFMEILDGKEQQENPQRTKGENQEEKEEKYEISREEVTEQVRKLKTGKTAGGYGIENEVWKYVREIGEEMVKLIRKIWAGKGIPKEWKTSVICPIYKKGDNSKVENYRGAVLMSTAYEIYSSILNERLMKEVDKKLGEGQFGFRRGSGIMDAVFVLNHVIDKETSKRKGKVFTCLCTWK